MKTILLVLIWAFLSASLTVHADEWFCETQTSERIGNEIHACGVSVRPSLDEARIWSFEHSKDEFKKICRISSDCINHKIIVTPMRTECSQVKVFYHNKIEVGYECNRMISFTIGELKT